jgi:hypothetical protein
MNHAQQSSVRPLWIWRTPFPGVLGRPFDSLGGIRKPTNAIRTDRLWEISDLVAMLEAWEAKEKRGTKPIFEVLERKIGGGFYVKATLPNTEPENITGFVTKNDAVRRIRNDSAAWLHARQHMIEKKEVAK